MPRQKVNERGKKAILTEIVSASRPPAEATEALNRVCFCLLVAAGCYWLLLLPLSRFAGSPASAAEAAGTAAVHFWGFLELFGAPLVHVCANLELF